MLVVGAFLGGMSLQRRLDNPIYVLKPPVYLRLASPDVIELPDGSRWCRFAPTGDKTMLWAMALVAVLSCSAAVGLRTLHRDIRESPSVIKPHERQPK
jgi:hypothetical protein